MGAIAMARKREVRLVSHMPQLTRELAARQQRPITQEIIAAETGISIATVNRWMRGKITMIDKNVLFAFCKFYEIPLEESRQLIELLENDE